MFSKKVKLTRNDLKNYLPEKLYKFLFVHDDLDELKTLNKCGMITYLHEKFVILFINNLNVRKFIHYLNMNYFIESNNKPKTIFFFSKYKYKNQTYFYYYKSNIYEVLFNTLPCINRDGSFRDMNKYDNEMDKLCHFADFFKKMISNDIKLLLDYAQNLNYKKIKNWIAECDYDITLNYLRKELNSKLIKKNTWLTSITMFVAILSLILSIFFYLFPRK